MARSVTATPIVQGPLNRANIDKVTHQDHDHFQLWNDTNTLLKSHSDTLTSLQATIADLQAQIKALQS